MKIKSINIAKPVEIMHARRIVETGIYKKPVSHTVSITRHGLAGDHIIDKTVHGGEDQAIYIYSDDDNHWWSEKLGRPVEPGTFGENLTISSFTTNGLKIGDRLKINEVILEITAPRVPCYKLAKKMDDSNFIKIFAAAVKPGAYARVIQAGNIGLGDEVVIQKTPEDYALVDEVFIQWHSSEKSIAFLKKALASPISCHHRKKIQQWIDS